MRKSALSVAWVMALVTSVVALAIAAGAVILAIIAPPGSGAQLDAWRGAAVSIGMLLASSTLLAVLTGARLRRGEVLVDEVADDAVPVLPVIAPVVDEQEARSV